MKYRDEDNCVNKLMHIKESKKVSIIYSIGG